MEFNIFSMLLLSISEWAYLLLPHYTPMSFALFCCIDISSSRHVFVKYWSVEVNSQHGDAVRTSLHHKTKEACLPQRNRKTNYYNQIPNYISRYDVVQCARKRFVHNTNLVTRLQQMVKWATFYRGTFIWHIWILPLASSTLPTICVKWEAVFFIRLVNIMSAEKLIDWEQDW